MSVLALSTDMQPHKLTSTRPEKSDNWPVLFPIKPSGVRRPFFVVAAPNVNPIGYGLLARHLDPDQPVFGLQPNYKKLTEGEYTDAELGLLAAESIKAMRDVQPDGPFLLGGMCQGALIAFTMARQLGAQGHEVALLAIFDTWVAENTYSRFAFYLDYYIHRIASLVRLSPRQQLGVILSIVSKKLRNLKQRMHKHSTGQRVNPWIDAYWPASDFVPPVYAGRVTLFRIRKQPYTRIRDARLGWGARATGGVEVHLIPGQHKSILREPNVTVLARELSDCIRRAQAD